MIHARIAGPGAAAVAKSLVIPNTPEPIVEPIIYNVSSVVLIPFFLSIGITPLFPKNNCILLFKIMNIY